MIILENRKQMAADDNKDGDKSTAAPDASKVTEATAGDDKVTIVEVKSDGGESSVGGTAPPSGGLAERALDIAFGAALLAAEALEKAVDNLSEKAKQAKEYAPAVLDAVQEKGRPAREKAFKSFRDDVTNPVKTAVGVAPAAPVSAEDEIRTLEERVKTLEAQVAPSSPDAEAVGPETTAAEDGTRIPDAAPTALADSDYAVSETSEEVARETGGSDSLMSGADTGTDFMAYVAPVAPPAVTTGSPSQVTETPAEAVTEVEMESGDAKFGAEQSGPSDMGVTVVTEAAPSNSPADEFYIESGNEKPAKSDSGGDTA